MLSAFLNIAPAFALKPGSSPTEISLLISAGPGLGFKFMTGLKWALQMGAIVCPAGIYLYCANGTPCDTISHQVNAVMHQLNSKRITAVEILELI